MKIQLALLLVVVLFVSLPSVVFSQPPLGAVQSGETSQTAPKAETVKKSWEGPIFGLGLGLGLLSGTVSYQGASEDTPITGALPVEVRLGYGLSESAVLYGSVASIRGLGEVQEWVDPYGLLGMMFRGGWSSRYYGFAALGTSLSSPRGIYFKGGSGTEVYPGLSLEGACTVEYFNYEGLTTTAVLFDLTFNYHFY